jgi:hypothetical protein
MIESYIGKDPKLLFIEDKNLTCFVINAIPMLGVISLNLPTPKKISSIESAEKQMRAKFL